jgi:hypothetical protein
METHLSFSKYKSIWFTFGHVAIHFKVTFSRILILILIYKNKEGGNDKARTLFKKIFVGLGFKLSALCLQGRRSTARATSPVHFALVIFGHGSCKLLAVAGLKTRSSLSQPPK